MVMAVAFPLLFYRSYRDMGKHGLFVARYRIDGRVLPFQEQTVFLLPIRSAFPDGIRRHWYGFGHFHLSGV